LMLEKQLFVMCPRRKLFIMLHGLLLISLARPHYYLLYSNTRMDGVHFNPRGDK
jgi:hypothetical protein